MARLLLRRVLVNALALAAVAHALVRVPAVFSNGMVLQTNTQYGQRPVIYGEADVGEAVLVTVTVNAKTSLYPVVADDNGDWIAQLNPSSNFGAAATVNITGSSDNYANVITISDVYYGDVYLCSGQSNMDFSLKAAFNGTAIASKSYPNIHLFAVAEGGAPTQQPDVPVYVNASASPCWWVQTNPAEGENVSCNTWQVAQGTALEYFSAVCFLTALQLSELYTGSRPIGLIFSAVGGTAISNWSPPEALQSCNYSQASGANTAYVDVEDKLALGAPTVPEGPSFLWNAMIYPLSRYPMRAVLWYQGEADSGDAPGVYSCLLQAMIEAWRRRWRIGDFAFMFVQLAPQLSATQPDYSWFQVRMEQASALPMPGGKTDTTGMAVTYDLGDSGSPYPPDHVHPRNKTEVARRLALQLLHVQYALQYPNGGDFNNYRGPSVVNATLSGSSIVVTFDVLDGSAIFLNDTHDCWECCAAARDTFQVSASAAGPWVNTSVAGVDAAGAVVTVLPAVKGTYSYVRYAAHTWPQCAVFASGSGIPSAPFQVSIVAAVQHVSPVLSQRAAEVSAAARLDAARERLVPVAKFGPNTWTSWRGMPISRRADGDAAIVAATPPMGFNTWNAFHTNLDENVMRKTADALISTGLAALGFRYVNCDDGWQVDRHPNGTIIEDPVRFPSGMKALADYMHSQGMLFGLYTSQTNRTCQSRPGSYMYEQQDVDFYCAIGLDYIKIDLCGGTQRPVLNTSWILFHQGIEACIAGGGRPMVESIEYCSDPNNCGKWIANMANLWRTTGDIQATFASVLSNLDDNDKMAAVAGPGHWNDPDMLQVGNAGLTLEEQKSHYSLWCLVAAPLLIGTDLVSGIDNATLSILAAPEVIAVDQDPLGVQGVRVSPANASGVECWARPLADGSVAAVLFNRGATTDTPVCTWQQLGLDPSKPAALRDLWARADLGNFTGSFTASVPSHGVLMFRAMQ